MLFSDDDKELIKICLLKSYRPTKLKTEFTEKNWKRNGLHMLPKEG